MPKVQEIKQKLAQYSTGASEHENAVFSHLLTFFSRYYDKSDFISQRRYKSETYAIPYAGEEVVLHWANKDQYYIKSSENFSNYAFKLDDGRTVRFRLVTADTAKDNRKDNDKERRFVLIEKHTRILTDEEGDEIEEELVPVTEENGELVLRFEYRAMPKNTPDSKQEKLVAGEDSDILNVVRFLAGFLNDEADTKKWLADLLANTARLLDAKGNNIFQNRFTPLMPFNADVVYSGILKLLFNTDARQRLKVVNLKRSKGELMLRVGDAEPFGLINIGDDAGFFKEAEKPGNIQWFDTEADDFAGSLFGTLNSKDSRMHVLIGSRKFTEGWSSWRVSTTGLLNMGQGEGSQIIQLFGRGVRLKGKAYSLKRSTPGQRPKGIHLERLETLNIFGVNAGYMAAFKDYLKEEGITPSDEIIELDFQTRINLPESKLKSLALKDGYKDNQIKGFKRTHFPWLYEVPGEFEGKINKVSIDLDLYPKIEALSTQDKTGVTTNASIRNKGKIASTTMALFDFDRIYLAIEEFKQQRSWSNLRLERTRLMDFCRTHDDWYNLYIPQAELVIRLLQDYTDRFYKSLKTAYEGQFYDIVHIRKDDDALIKMYHFEIDNTDDGEVYGK